MFKDDYIMRMIEQMADFFKKILKLEDNGDYDECHGEIDAALRKLGVSRLLTRTMPANELLRLIRRPGTDDVSRCMLLSRLISTDAGVYEKEEQRRTAHGLYTTSLQILNEIEDDADEEKAAEIQKDKEALRMLISENANSDIGNMDV